MTDAAEFVRALEGKPIRTISGRENRVLLVGDGDVVVWTTKSPAGQPVPISWVQDAIDRLERDREIEISVESVRYRSAFIGAALQLLPGATVVRTSRHAFVSAEPGVAAACRLAAVFRVARRPGWCTSAAI